MKEATHINTKDCTFVCATCGNKFIINTTLKEETHAIDICSKCHPFYMGKTTNKQLRGKSEKLFSKFEAGKANINAKAAKVPKERKSKDNKGLDSL